MQYYRASDVLASGYVNQFSIYRRVEFFGKFIAVCVWELKMPLYYQYLPVLCPSLNQTCHHTIEYLRISIAPFNVLRLTFECKKRV